MRKRSGNFGANINGPDPGAGSPNADSPDVPRELPARRGFSVLYRGKTLLSRIDPVGQGERLAADVPVKERTLYFCPSPLYGYGLSALLKKLPKDSAVLCVEADEKLFEISRNALDGFREENAVPQFPSGERKLRPLALLRAADPETVCAYARKTWGERQFRRVEEIRLGGGWQLFPRLYDGFASALRRCLAVEWGNAMTLIRLGRLYARNLIKNLSLLSESPAGEAPGGAGRRDASRAAANIAELDFGPSPVLVLGAGPSLDSILDEMAALFGGKLPGPGERRFKIVCVDTCIPALLERGVEPDLAVVLESQHWNLRDFTGARGRRIDAAFDLSALPASTRALGGRRFFFATPWTELALFRRLEKAGLLPETLIPMGSVGPSAAALALARGSGPALLGGIDFSFTLDAYHARSTPGQGALERGQNRFRSLINAGAAFREGCFPALSKTGLAVRCDPAMRSYRNLFEREFGGNPRLFDIAGPGLPLGVKTISVAEAFAILNAESGAGQPAGSLRPGPNSPGALQKEKIAAFIRREKEALVLLREILLGEKTAPPERLDELLDYADYLWAHFPECAGADGPENGERGGARRPPRNDLGFLKRVRAEIDKFVECWELASGEGER